MKATSALLVALSLTAFGKEKRTEFIYQESETKQVIPYRDGVLVEAGEGKADRVMYAAGGATVTERVEVEGMQFLFDVEQNGKDVLFLGLKDGKIAVFRESPGGKRVQVPVPDAFHPRFYEDLLPATRPLLLETRHQAAAIAGDVVWWLDGAWKSKKIPKVPAFHREFKRGNPPDHYYLEGTTLYVGWNHGEWGGQLASIDLIANRPKWRHLGGRKQGDSSGIPGNEPVSSIVSPKEGHLWVSTGLSHLTSSSGAVHHRTPDGKWYTIINSEERQVEDDKLPEGGSVGALAFDHEERIHLMGSSMGILRLEDSGKRRLCDKSAFDHVLVRNQGTNSYHLGLYPEDLGISRDGGIFVSTNSFGVLEIRGKDGVQTVRQIRLHEPDDSKPDGSTLPPSRESGIEKLPENIEGE